jgi:hypothetical protein
VVADATVCSCCHTIVIARLPADTKVLEFVKPTVSILKTSKWDLLNHLNIYMIRGVNCRPYEPYVWHRLLYRWTLSQFGAAL